MTTAIWIIVLIILACIPVLLSGDKKTDGCGGCGGRGNCPGCRHRKRRDE